MSMSMVTPRFCERLKLAPDKPLVLRHQMTKIGRLLPASKQTLEMCAVCLRLDALTD